MIQDVSFIVSCRKRLLFNLNLGMNRIALNYIFFKLIGPKEVFSRMAVLEPVPNSSGQVTILEMGFQGCNSREHDGKIYQITS